MALFQTPDLDDRERRVLAQIDKLRERLRYLIGESPRRWQGLLRRNTFARAIQGSNSIEGYHVSVEDAVAAVDGEEPADTTTETWHAVRGYRAAMTYVMQMADDPYFRFSPGIIKSLHFMMMEHDLTRNPGKWRPGSVYVRRESTGETVYEGPPAEQVPGLVDELVASVNSTGRPHATVAGAMVHLNLVMIHPFSDGNGRMARCLQTLILARHGVLSSVFSSIEEYLGRNTPSYYDVLAHVGQGRWHPDNDARPWLRYCLTAHFRQATTLLTRSREYERLWNELEQVLTRLKLPPRLAMGLSDAAVGLRIRNPTYRSVAEVSDQVAGKDLRMAVERGLLEARGERRGRYYVASPMLTEMRERVREPTRVPDPFEDALFGE